VLDANGLRIVIVHVPGSPAVTTNIVYGVGSADEMPGRTGLAHMLEHMLFKPLNDASLPTWKTLEEKGALLNATTWMDRTMYYFSLPTPYLPLMLQVEAARMRSVLLADKEFTPERTNVLSELEMYNSNAEEALGWLVTCAAFQSHGYGHDTIGFKNDVERYVIDDLTEFYNRYYWPHNATLVVAGDVSVEETLAAVSNTFGSIVAPTSIIPARRAIEPTQEGERRVSLRRKTALRVFSASFKAPAFGTRSWLALLIAGSYFIESKVSVLHEALVDTHHATGVSHGLYPTKDPYLSDIKIWLTEGTPYETVERILFAEIEKFGTQRISPSRLRDIKARLRSEELFSRDGTFRIASNIAEHIAVGDWTYYYRILDDLASITAQEVQDAVRAHWTRDSVTIGTIDNI
jgi:zinc protease